VRKVLGKVKSGIDTGAKIFRRGKEIYGSAKNFISNVPVIGTTAVNAIIKAEGQANEYAKKKVGVNFGDVDRAVSTAERVSKFLPSS
jgi:hypothetical protein